LSGSAKISKKDGGKGTTELMAKALAEGLLKQDENGYWRVDKEGLENSGINLSEKQLLEFAYELGDGAEELRQYGQEIQSLTE
jgi:hypothetical protein